VKKGILITLFLFTLSCATKDFEIDYTTVTLKLPSHIIKGKPNYLIYPLNSPNKPPSAFLVPFNIEVNIEKNRIFLQRELTKILYSNFLQNQVFKRFVLSKKNINNIYDAIKSAREKKCRLVIIPTLTYCFFGGRLSPTKMAIKIDIYDTRSQDLIWSITHMGEIKVFEDKDYIFWKTKYNYPLFPEAVLLSGLLDDINRPIKRWAEDIEPIFPKKEKKQLRSETSDWNF